MRLTRRSADRFDLEGDELKGRRGAAVLAKLPRCASAVSTRAAVFARRSLRAQGATRGWRVACSARRAMEIPVRYAMPEHETIRRLLEDVVCCAAAAETAPYPEHTALARAAAAVKRALHHHAMHEGHAGRTLDALHDAEDAAAVELRCALGLEDVLAQVARIAQLLAEEEVALERLG